MGKNQRITKSLPVIPALEHWDVSMHGKGVGQNIRLERWEEHRYRRHCVQHGGVWTVSQGQPGAIKGF